jgi:chemotaxis protein methyltransferase CheR
VPNRTNPYAQSTAAQLSPKQQSTRSSGVGEDYVLSDRDFDRIAQRLRETCGIVLHNHKRQMVISRLSRRLRSGGFASFSEYLDHVESERDATESEAFANALTTNLTSFFREPHHFEHFAKHIIEPKLASGDPKLRVWSAGCSTGEEPYTIAMVLMSLAKSVPPDFRILATDIDTTVLSKAKAGLYDTSKLEGIPEYTRRMFRFSDQEKKCRVSANLIEIVKFLPLNLLNQWPMKGPFDAIFCRNVLIYFDASTKFSLVDRFADLLPRDGVLYLGHSESILGEHPKLESLGRTIYRRK